MKKIIPVIALVGVGSLVAIGSSNLEKKKDSFVNNLNAFQEDLNDYATLNEKNLTKTAFNKYNLSIVNDTLQDLTSIQDEMNVVGSDESINEDQISTENETTENEILEENNIENETDVLTTQEIQENEKISTLYSLSGDIEDSCEDFCELKEEITEAIVETQNLINKVQSNELELTKEQRMFITEQSMQLKNLGRQLSNITTELSFHLSDLNQIMATSGDNIDNLNLKYLIVLDNLVNGNEMLQSSLSSLNLINQMFNTRSTLPPNNHGRILYGFQQNDNPPVVRDYYIDENGELIENSQTEEDNQNEATEENAVEVEEKTNNIDTYQNRALETNIDTFYNGNVQRNIDSFFNTALLDNEFMYGNGAYGYGGNGMYGPANPYLNNYANYERNNTNNSGYNMDNAQASENKTEQQVESKQEKKERKRIKLKKNIDTYKDENEPDIKTKLGNIKNSISDFFGKFKNPNLKADLDDKIENPIYRFDAKKKTGKN